MMRFTGSNNSLVWASGKLVGPPGFVRFVETKMLAGGPVAFDYWYLADPGLNDAWSTYVTVGWCWATYYGEVPRVEPVPEPPGGYEPEGPVE